MYFDFEDYRPDISPVGRAISWREGILISIIFHLMMVIVLITAPDWLTFETTSSAAPQVARNESEEPPRFVFMEPLVDEKAPSPPDRAELSDQDRRARERERSQRPDNPLPFSRGNSPERVEQAEPETARGAGPAPDPAEGQQQPPQEAATPPVPERNEGESVQLRQPESQQANNALGRRPLGGGALGAALRDLGRYIQRDQFENAQGSAGAFGPAIQFDSKGVDFGPWIRRFIAQVKGNWLIPLAAMSMRGHVVVTFNIHKNGMISDLSVAAPSGIAAFDHAAYGAIAASNPTQPLPPEYPADQAFFTITFFYNEQP